MHYIGLHSAEKILYLRSLFRWEPWRIDFEEMLIKQKKNRWLVLQRRMTVPEKRKLGISINMWGIVYVGYIFTTSASQEGAHPGFLFYLKRRQLKFHLVFLSTSSLYFDTWREVYFTFFIFCHVFIWRDALEFVDFLVKGCVKRITQQLFEISQWNQFARINK